MSLVVIFETVRRHITNVLYVVFTIMVAAIAFIAGHLGAGAEAWRGFTGLLILVAGSQLIGPEFSSGTLQLILARPINRSVYLLSRYAGVIAAIWIFIAVATAFESLGAMNGRNPTVFSQMFAGSAALAIGALLTCALLAFFGTFLRSHMNVAFHIALQVFLEMALAAIARIRPDMPGPIGAMARFFDRHPGVARVTATIGRNLYPDRPPAGLDRNWLMLILSNSAVALLLACLIFRRREVPYGAD